MPPELAHRIASITDRVTRKNELNTWSDSQTTQTTLGSYYPQFQRHVHRSETLERLSNN